MTASMSLDHHYSSALLIGNMKEVRYGAIVLLFTLDARLRNAVSDAPAEPIYRVTFYNQNDVYEIYAKHVFQSDLWGFLEVEEFVFGERTQMIVDPAEEKLKTEFCNIKRSFIPMQSVVRIDEVEKEGTSKITEASGGNISPFPYPSMAAVKPKKD